MAGTMVPSNIPTGKSKGGSSTWFQRTANIRTAYSYLLPALIVMLVITFYPLFYQVWMSFTDYNVRSLNPNSAVYLEPNFIGLQNYIDIGSTDGRLQTLMPNLQFWRLLSFNLFWTFVNVIFHVTIGIAIALLLHTKGLWFKGIYRALFILPVVIPSLVIATVWRNMYDPDFGAINQTLASIGALINIPPEVFRIRWIDQINPPFSWFLPGMPLPLSFFAMLITNIWLGWPLNTVVATGALASVPEDLYEAAAIDGATWWNKTWYITLPLIRPAMVPYAMLGTIMTFNLFNISYFLSGGGPLRQTEIMVTTAFRLVNENREYGLAAAFSIVIFFVLLILTLFTNRISRATESYDA